MWAGGGASAGAGTHHDLAAFDHGDSEVEDLHLDGFDIGGLQVSAAELVGGAHDEVIFWGPQPTRLGQGVGAGAHEVVQGSVECQVMGVPRDSAGSGPWAGGDGVQRGTDPELPSWRVHIGMVPMAHRGGWCDLERSRSGTAPASLSGSLKTRLWLWAIAFQPSGYGPALCVRTGPCLCSRPHGQPP